MTRKWILRTCVLALLVPALPASAEEPKSGFMVAIEATTLQPSGGMADFALSDPDDDQQPEGTINSLDYSSAVSPRIYLGWTMKGGGTWMLSGWSYDEDESQTLTATAPATLWDILYHADEAFDDYSGTAMAAGNMKASVYDLVYSVPAHTSDKMSVYWQVGLRQASLDNDLGVVYDNAGSTNNAFFRSEADGLGLKGGVHATLNLSKQWNVTAGAAMSLLSGDVDSSTLMFDGVNGPTAPDAEISAGSDRVLSIFDASVSVVWNPTESWYFWLGYEYSQWNDVVEMRTFPDDIAEGAINGDVRNVTFDGASLGVGFVF